MNTANRTAAISGILDAKGVAQLLECHRNWVYDHARDLGAWRIGEGHRWRLVFDRSRVESIARLLVAGDATLPPPDEWAVAPPTEVS